MSSINAFQTEQMPLTTGKGITNGLCTTHQLVAVCLYTRLRVGKMGIQQYEDKSKRKIGRIP